MRVDNLAYLCRAELGVPGAFGVDDHHRAAVAEAEAAAAGNLHVVSESGCAKLAMQRVENAKGPCRRTAGDAFRFFLGANECVITKRWQGNLQVSSRWLVAGLGVKPDANQTAEIAISAMLTSKSDV